MEFTQPQAIYLQIGDYICENILRRSWHGGDRIPSIRELAMDVQVNPNTVTRTYAYLQDQGIIFNRRGIGYLSAAASSTATCRNCSRPWTCSAWI